jgi:hypothetical protein
MSHDNHRAVPGYSPSQVLFDGCRECDHLGLRPALAIGHMDTETFALAWQRAAISGSEGLADIAEAEVLLLDILHAVQVQLRAYGLSVGELPNPRLPVQAAIVAEHPELAYLAGKGDPPEWPFEPRTDEPGQGQNGAEAAGESTEAVTP